MSDINPFYIQNAMDCITGKFCTFENTVVLVEVQNEMQAVKQLKANLPGSYIIVVE
jgi:hypothetical protein